MPTPPAVVVLREQCGRPPPAAHLGAQDLAHGFATHDLAVALAGRDPDGAATFRAGHEAVRRWPDVPEELGRAHPGTRLAGLAVRYGGRVRRSARATG